MKFKSNFFLVGLVGILMLVMSSPLFSQQTKTKQTDSDYFNRKKASGLIAHGARFGGTVSYSTNYINTDSSDPSRYNLSPYLFLSQFGYHLEFRFFNKSQVTPLFQIVGLVAGIESSYTTHFSLSFLAGLRFNENIELGGGIYFNPVANGIVLAVGYNIVDGQIYYPINLAVVLSQTYFSATLLLGFNFPSLD